MTKPPIALFIFSNDVDDYLHQIKTEKKRIRQAFEPYVETNRLIVIIETFTTKAELIRLFQRYENRIVLFHFSGHAGSQGLQLNEDITNTDFVYVDGIARLIAKEAKQQLKFVFLNGCSTIVQAEILKQTGVPSIISTHFPISDNNAVRFAISFYNTLTNNAKINRFEAKPTTITQTFEDAKTYLKLSYTTPIITSINTGKRRGFIFHIEETETKFPWELSTTEPNWHLPNIAINKTKKIGSKPFLLSADKFLGRTTELETIHNRLFNQNTLLLLVNGEGGIGKTTLAAKYYQRYEADYEYLIWVYAERGIMEAILTLEIPLKLKLDPKLDQNQRFEAILNELHRLPKPSLLVIDNANNLEDVEKHHFELAKFTNLHILLTSRINELSEVPMYKIKPLPKDMAIALFKKHYSRHYDKDDALLENILEAVGYNTLVIELLAKNLRNLNKLKDSYQLSDLLTDLQERGLLQLSKSKKVKTPYNAKNQLQHAKPEAIIAAMYDINQLNDEEQKLLSNFAVLPAENIPFEYLEVLLTDFEDLETTLLEVAQKGWLDFDVVERSFKVSPVIQEVINQRIDNQLQNSKGLINNLKEKIKYDGRSIEGANSKDIIFFIRYSEATIQNINQPDYELAILQEHIGSYYSIKGDLINASSYYYSSKTSFSKLLKLEPNNFKFKEGKAILTSKLGENYKYLGQNEKALDIFKKGEILFIELLNSDKENEKRHSNNIALSYQFIGMIHSSYGNNKEALECFKHFNKIEKKLNSLFPSEKRFKNLLAISYSLLAEMYFMQNNLNQAIEHRNIAVSLSEELCQEVPNSQNYIRHLAISYEKLADINMKMGNKTEGERLYFEENRMFQILLEKHPENADYKNLLSISYSKLCKLSFLKKEINTAFQYCQKYHNLKKELFLQYPNNIKFKNGFALALSRSGEIYLEKKEFDNAQDSFNNCQEILYELYHQDPNNVDYKRNIADTYRYLGNAYKSSKVETSVHFFEKSFEIIIKLVGDNPTIPDYKNLLAEINLDYGKFYKDSQEPEKAKKYFQKAEQLWKELTNQAPKYIQYREKLNTVTTELNNL